MSAEEALEYAHSKRKAAPLQTAVLELLVGVRLILSPLSISRLVLSIGGVALIVIGVCNLVAHYRSTRYIPEPGGIIDADE